jgi:ribosomal protein L7/L12
LDDEPIGEATGAAQPDDLLALAREGRTIEAIKRYRAQTGAGLKEAKDAVEVLLATGRLPIIEGRPAATTAGDEFDNRILELVRTGRKIEAIKEYRQRTGAGLKEAKDAVEALAARHGILAKSAGCAGVLLVLLLSGVLTVCAAG